MGMTDISTVEDGGTMVIIENNGRELTLVTPPSGSPCYFAAKSNDYKRTGIISNNMGRIILWLNGVVARLNE